MTEMLKGHLDQQRQGVRSTKAATQFLSPPTQCTQENDIGVTVWDLKHTTYLDQTGCFPFTSYKGNKYMMVVVELDSSAILVEAMKDRTSEELTRAYLNLFGRIKRAGATPKKCMMDNELSEDLKEVTKKECKMELLPLGYHRQNAAELAIKIFKAHIIANFSWPSTIFSPLSVVQAVTHRLTTMEMPGDQGTWAKHSVDGCFFEIHSPPLPIYIIVQNSQRIN